MKRSLMKLRKLLVPNFFYDQKEEEVSNRMFYHRYEFSLDLAKQNLDLEKTKKIILNNPWCLLSPPCFEFSEESENSVKISYYVLSKNSGKKLQERILNQAS
ncbi:hypothetical protein [Ekhidna sp.]|uniref:hypothetical protein n=1 Tax=Ekhidna sp. TaxID=2608089 RepID=UPI003299A5B4